MLDRKCFPVLLLNLFLCLSVSQAAAGDPQILMWEEMIPREEMAMPELPPGAEEEIPGTENLEPLMNWLYGTETVKELDGKYVKLPGFIVPLESDEGGLLDEFLLVPYFGACIHVPPPPPNQIVYVKLEKPVEILDIWDPFWIIGTMETKPYVGAVAETVYQMAAERIEKYDY